MSLFAVLLLFKTADSSLTHKHKEHHRECNTDLCTEMAQVGIYSILPNRHDTYAYLLYTPQVGSRPKEICRRKGGSFDFGFGAFRNGDIFQPIQLYSGRDLTCKIDALGATTAPRQVATTNLQKPGTITDEVEGLPLEQVGKSANSTVGAADFGRTHHINCGTATEMCEKMCDHGWYAIPPGHPGHSTMVGPSYPMLFAKGGFDWQYRCGPEHWNHQFMLQRHVQSGGASELRLLVSPEGPPRDLKVLDCPVCSSKRRLLGPRLMSQSASLPVVDSSAVLPSIVMQTSENNTPTRLV